MKFDLDEASFGSAFDEDEVTVKVVNNLNEIFGKDVKNLHKAKDLVEKLKLTQRELEQRLLFATSEAPDKISKAINTAQTALARSEEIDRCIASLNNEISDLKSRKNLSSIMEEISPNLKIIQEAEKVKAYYKWLSAIQDLSSQLETSLKLGHEEKALIQHGKLKESAQVITASKCKYLKEYTCEMVLHWHKILLKCLESEFQSVLKTVKWPFGLSSSAAKTPSPSSETIQRLQTLIKHLLQLDDISEQIRSGAKATEGDERSTEEEGGFSDKVTPSLISDFSVSSFPLRLMLKSLEVRFLYHFSGEKATNSRRHPEWYLTQLLGWAAAHEAFVDAYVQPVLSRCSRHPVNAKVELTKGLVRLAVLKLCSDLQQAPGVEGDEDLFCHTVQETLNFERELRLGLGYPAAQPTVLRVLTQAAVFNRWIAIERKFALELMDEFVASGNAWHSDEEGGTCRCGEQLVLLLQGITDRYKPLSQPGHRLQFLDLQLELLDDFRVRILQLSKSELSDPLRSNYIPILNTVHYLVCTIADWADLPFFIEMQYFKEKYSSAADENKSPPFNYTKPKVTTGQMRTKASEDVADEPLVAKQVDEISLYLGVSGACPLEVSESVFKPLLNLYSHIESEMLCVVTQHALTEVRARSQSYRRDKWFLSPSEASLRTAAAAAAAEMSPSLCPLLETLVRHLLLLRRNLAPRLFSKLWREIAAALNKFIYEEMILQNTFSEYGAAQLNHDMTKALFPIFGEFSTKPENFFPLIKESLILLTLPRATAFLLRDTLHEQEEEAEAAGAGRDFYRQSASSAKALEERGVLHLGVREAKVVLDIRTNMIAS